MHMFARNYVKLLKQEAPSEYGQHLEDILCNQYERGMFIRRTLIDCANGEF